MTSPRRFPPPWQVEQIPGGYKALDASGQTLAYVYARETKAEADIAKVLTFDEARRIAVNVAKLAGFVGSEMVNPEPPEGKFFSQVYVDHGAPVQDSPRMRARLGALLNDMGPPRFEKWTESKFGISICTADWRDFLKEADLKDVLDTVTLAYKALASVPSTKNRERHFVRSVNAIFRDENLHYAVDEKGGVHFAIDKAFTANQTATLARLGLPRYANVRANFEQVDAALSDVPPDGKSAVRATFDAAEALFKLVFSEERRLANGSAMKRLGPAFQQVYEGNAPALEAASKEVEAFSKWIDACHNYRHALGGDEPLAPPLDLAVQLVGAGATYIRWLVQLDAWRLSRNLGA